MKPLEVYQQAVALGLKLERAGDRLLVFGDRCPPEFADMLRVHKAELLDWLTRTTTPPGDERTLPTTAKMLHRWPTGQPMVQPVTRGGTDAQWLHAAKQVLAGEFDGAEDSMREALTIGLRSIPHPDCRRALERLQPKPKKGNTP
jgi:hypothetical protein